MCSDAHLLDHVLDQLGGLSGITHRRMFGEYALYHHGKVVAFICDNRLFLKPSAAGRASAWASHAVASSASCPVARPAACWAPCWARCQ